MSIQDFHKVLEAGPQNDPMIEAVQQLHATDAVLAVLKEDDVYDAWSPWS
ncbi:MAG: hypothetical protein AAGN66_26335 [Acidobacteriota bacterium]